MKKFNIIILILICINFKFSVNQEADDPIKIFSSIIGGIIINVTQICTDRNKDTSCISSIKDGLELIKNMTDFKYNEFDCNELKTIIFRNNGQTKTIYVKLAQNILRKLERQIKIRNWKSGCKVYCREKYDKNFLKFLIIPFCVETCSLINAFNFRSLFVDELIDKEKLCLYLMEIFEADSEYCYE